jgi:hypothetical protein
MLRVTESEEGGLYVLMVEGKLTGATLGPLAELLRRLPAASGGGRPVLVDLMGVTAIDAEGKQMLKELHSLGATFRAKGCLNRAIVDGITCGAPEPAGAGVRPEQQADGSEQGEKI